MTKSCFFSLVLLVSALGCSSGPAQKVLLDNKPRRIVGYEEAEAPLSVSILSEKYNNPELAVTLLVSPLKDMQEGEIEFRLVGLQNGLEVTQTKISLDRDLQNGESYEFPLTLSNNSITDYRVDVEWGGRLVRAAKPLILVDNIQTLGSSCRESMCRAEFKLLATITNDAARGLGGAVLNSVTLATSFSLKGRPALPENLMEEALKVDNLGLEPGAKRKIEITLEQEVPQAVLALLQPQVRIASYN
jgi:hypothetical protein